LLSDISPLVTQCSSQTESIEFEDEVICSSGMMASSENPECSIA